MVERRSQSFRSAAVPLIHADDIHAGGQALGGDPLHVGGIARALKAVDDDDRQSILPVALPVAMDENLNAGFHLDVSRLGWGQRRAAGEEEAGQGLPMSAAEAAPRDESRQFRLHSLHCLILNGYDQIVLAA